MRVERPGRRSFRKRLHCASPWGMRRHARHLVEGRIGMDDQAMMDVDHLLGEDHRAAAEGEVVEGRRDGSFEGVLLAHDPERCAPSVDAVEHLVEGGAFEHGRLAETESVRERARCFVGVGSHPARETRWCSQCWSS